MKKLIIGALALFIFPNAAIASSSLFVNESCNHCSELKVYLTENNYYEQFDIQEFDIAIKENLDLYLEKSKEVEYTGGGVPLLVVEENYYEGKVTITNYLEQGISPQELSDVSKTTINADLSDQLNTMIAENGINISSNQPMDSITNPSTDNRTETVIGLIVIVFGLTFAAGLIKRALNKKRK